MTDECRIILDDALTAVGNGTAMSAKVAAHLETCSECRRSLEAVKALSASAGSVLLIENNTALKQKIAAKLEASMLARKAIAEKTAASSPAALALLGLGLAAFLAFGAYSFCSSNQSQASIKTNPNSPVSTITSTSSETDQKNLPQNNDQYKEVYQEIFSDGYEGDLRNFEKVKQPTETVPSATKD